MENQVKASEPHLDRMKVEETELNEKIVKLENFINSEKFIELSSLHSVQQSLMRSQLYIMKAYSECLKQRQYLYYV